ncbi:MAG: T9SS type A sorting domain-containing protein, partial [Candidatus Marinimicrobia bacterium]|nr:T9SS type A sorting domain-containing protein [Candidatus Neomarinimicrobiota bacterium]
FDIERRGDTWEKIGFVKGEGNSSSPVSYTFVDKNVSGLQNLHYRLKQIDNDGTYEYSPIASVTLKEIVLPSEFSLHSNYPNPFNPATTIAYEIAVENMTTLAIYDMQGKLVETLINEQQSPGHYKATFDGGDLASGVYFCKLTSGNNHQFIKMLLVK